VYLHRDPIRIAEVKLLTSISFSVSAKACLSWSCAELREQDRHKPPKPMSSSRSLRFPVVSSALANLACDVSVSRSRCADSSVLAF
jgi:hypothetical protein